MSLELLDIAADEFFAAVGTLDYVREVSRILLTFEGVLGSILHRFF